MTGGGASGARLEGLGGGAVFNSDVIVGRRGALKPVTGTVAGLGGAATVVPTSAGAVADAITAGSGIGSIGWGSLGRLETAASSSRLSSPSEGRGLLRI